MAALLALVCAPGCSQSGGKAPTVVAAPAEDLEVVRGDLVDRVVLTGELDAVLSDEIVAPRTRQHMMSIRWMADDGAEVKAGERVLEFDNSSFASGLEEQKLAVRRARNDLESQSATNKVAIADKEYAVDSRRIALSKAKLYAEVPEDTSTRREYQERQLALYKAKVELERAEDDLTAQRKAADLEMKLKRIALEKAQREVRNTEELLESFVVKAPRDGLIVVAIHPWFGRKFQIGDTVHAGLTVLKLPNLSKIRVQAALSDVDDGRVAEGMHAVCTLDAYPDVRFHGKVKTVSPVAQESAQESLRRSFRVLIDLDEAGDDRMLPGMSVKVEIDGRKAENVLIAPRAGLDPTSDPPRAFLSDGRAEEVELGLCTVDGCEVKAGLEEGARLRGGGAG